MDNLKLFKNSFTVNNFLSTEDLHVMIEIVFIFMLTF